jgi:hypothetical protein
MVYVKVDERVDYLEPLEAVSMAVLKGFGSVV